MAHNTQWRGQLDALLDAFNERHASVGKGISHSTREARSQGLYRMFALLRKLGFKPVPENLAERHVRALMAYWTAQQLPADVLLDMPMTIPRRAYPCSAAYIQQQMSFIRVFASWIGKPGLVRSAVSYVNDPALVRRAYGALIDKGWESHGVSVDEVIAAVDAVDSHVGGQLAMMIAFGLRRKEAVMFCPRAAEVPAYALPVQHPRSDHYISFLRIKRGTKGGRLRYAAVRTPQQRQALVRARCLARQDWRHIGHPGLSLKQSLDLFSNVVRSVGLTKNDLGVTPHGLRHQFAGDLYFDITQVQPPVRGGELIIDREVMADAYRQVAEQLGHHRPQISNAYLGSPAGRRSDEVDLMGAAS